MPERLKSSATRNGTPSKTRLLGHLQRSRRAQKRGKHARKRLFSATLLIPGGGIASPIVIRLGARQKRRDWMGPPTLQDWMGPPTLRYQGNVDGTFRPACWEEPRRYAPPSFGPRTSAKSCNLDKRSESIV